MRQHIGSAIHLALPVPFQFSRYLRDRLPVGGFVLSSAGVTLTDLGNVFHNLTGSYGVNVFGNDFYKECMAQGAAQVRDLGPVLGSYHPVMLYNVKRLSEISGLDEISFHMSSTRSSHAGRAPGAIPHGAKIFGAILGRLSRLVGRRTTGHRQSDRRAAHLYPARDARRHLAGA